MAFTEKMDSLGLCYSEPGSETWDGPFYRSYHILSQVLSSLNSQTRLLEGEYDSISGQLKNLVVEFYEPVTGALTTQSFADTAVTISSTHELWFANLNTGLIEKITLQGYNALAHASNLFPVLYTGYYQATLPGNDPILAPGTTPFAHFLAPRSNPRLERTQGFKNVLINGNLDIWQRGTTFTATTAYAADRFMITAFGASVTVDRVAGYPPNGKSRYLMQLTGATGLTTVEVLQRIEASMTPMIRGLATYSAWIYNGGASSFTPSIRYCTPTVEDTFVAFNANTTKALQPCPPATWTKVKATIDLSAFTGLENGLEFALVLPDGSLGAGGLVKLGQMQLEEGPVATLIDLRCAKEELRLAQAFYFRFSTFPETKVALCRAMSASGLSFQGVFSTPVPMRLFLPHLTYGGTWQGYSRRPSDNNYVSYNVSLLSAYANVGNLVSVVMEFSAGNDYNINEPCFLKSGSNYAWIALDAEF
ncbi:MAG: hypothetical protein A2600_08905 [Candidatus Lambdaproteobacteria bacterium RIFOXYD1_FULL_56_27]|uniref:Uncharacterized protein n=1 Tax=Candidatus Lambdaproteobacteria bacterium RIFOXYD2_FULL_56_26 TaxID=1817773 RepID=A0A1F6GYU6_9PROT|nr:MAG: hypothetical protein A2426_10325 [Candidatus Lambdaproteobacteria bacterium RIFOXYC1_FULL_56_13]OGH03346.1 MAG: hypothetical protein A2557_02360 [Candidatus Lambdaproteobacteria bacterium RIFOXYD2_FULL_56_26]OGH06649.1 MAG: hypothetical protein A2600_08905 [Candidatus Lambdaproteobacteria bacterium RIFOXYD1_FULL_56_27]